MFKKILSVISCFIITSFAIYSIYALIIDFSYYISSDKYDWKLTKIYIESFKFISYLIVSVFCISQAVSVFKTKSSITINQTKKEIELLKLQKELEEIKSK